MLHGDGNALFKGKRHISRLVGRLFGRYAKLQNLVELRFVRGIFKIHALVREVPQVFIFGIIGFAGNFERDIVRLGIIDLLVAALDIPNAPGRDDGHFGRERFNGQFEAHLIVPLARAAVADRIGALFFGDLYDALGDDGARKRRAEQVFVLIYRARLDGRVNVIFYKLFAKVFDIQFGCPRFESLLFQPFQLAFLPHVGRNGNDFAIVVIFFQPRNDDRRVKPARIGENYFFDLLFHLRSFLFIKL